jgi:hypothetical protein
MSAYQKRKMNSTMGGGGNQYNTIDNNVRESFSDKRQSIQDYKVI